MKDVASVTGKVLLGGPRGATRIIVLCTCATRETRKKGCFFEAKHDSCESRLGVKMCLFLRKRVLLDSIKGV